MPVIRGGVRSGPPDSSPITKRDGGIDQRPASCHLSPRKIGGGSWTRSDQSHPSRARSLTAILRGLARQRDARSGSRHTTLVRTAGRTRRSATRGSEARREHCHEHPALPLSWRPLYADAPPRPLVVPDRRAPGDRTDRHPTPDHFEADPEPGRVRPLARPCLDCSRLHTNQTRCTHHQSRVTARQSAAYSDPEYKRNRKLLISEHVARHGWVCPGAADLNHEAHPCTDLTADHIVQVVHGGGHGMDNLRVLCASMNKARNSRASSDPPGG